MDRPTIDLCIPVWGRAYVRRWLDNVLPSWLSDGNLPALAAAAQLRAVLLTRACDFDAIVAHPLGRRLIEVCPVTLCAIDDLMATDMSAVTLTLAFTRGARLAQARGEGAVAAFVNVDFILADGSLRALGRAIAAGADIVLAPSLRAVEEQVTPMLPPADISGVMRCPPDVLARLALVHLHPTAGACFIDQEALTSIDAYEFFVNAGPGVVISRSMQLFPLAVKLGPEPVFADAFCDYGLFDLWASGGRTAVLGHSAEWFALELGAANQQASFLATGRHDPAALAARISIWSTAPQRAQLDHLVTIRSGPGSAEPHRAAVERLDTFVSGLVERLPQALPILNHPYWITGRRRWQAARPWPNQSDPPEIREPLPAPKGAGERMRETTRALFYGQSGKRRSWHVNARLERDLAPLREALASPRGPALDDDSLWLTRHAAVLPPRDERSGHHRVVCVVWDQLASAVDDAASDVNLERLDLILPGAPAETRDALVSGLAARLPGWQIDAVNVGRAADERRRAYIEAAGRALSTRNISGLARAAPLIVADALASGVAMASGRPVRWDAGQAVWIKAQRVSD